MRMTGPRPRFHLGQEAAPVARTPRPGREREFERWLQTIAQAASEAAVQRVQDLHRQIAALIGA